MPLTSKYQSELIRLFLMVAGPMSNSEVSPLVSVCIANYNGVDIIADCIDSVMSQIGGMSVEIIIHDDASTDGSVAYIQKNYPGVVVLASESNAGFCIANNRMVEKARGTYVLLLNNDAALFADAISTLVTFAESNRSLAILTLPQYDWESGALVDAGSRADLFYCSIPNLDATRQDVAYVIGACMFLRRQFWRELGGFPEWMGSIGEDLYICCLARLRGFAVGSAPVSGYRHRQGVSFGGGRISGNKLSTTYRRRYLSERNRASLVLVCTPTWLAWPLYALHLGILLIEGAAVACIKWDGSIWRSIYWSAARDSIRVLQRLRVSRQLAQSGCVVSFWTYVRVLHPIPQKLRLVFRHGLPSVR